MLPPDQVRSRYCLRLTKRDLPGVAGQVSNILGRHGVSLSAILQPESGETNGEGGAGKLVAVVITTHRTLEGPMGQSLAAIDPLPTVVPPTVCLRVIDQPREFAGGEPAGRPQRVSLEPS